MNNHIYVMIHRLLANVLNHPVDNTCPQCGANNSELTSFPIVSNESFTFDYNDKRVLELEFRPRPKRS